MSLKKDQAVGILMVILGIAIAVMTSQMKLSAMAVDSVAGPKLFPYIASVIIGLCGIGIFFSKSEQSDKAFLVEGGWKKVFIFFGLLILYTLGLKYLGFIISTLIILYCVLRLLANGKKLGLVPSIAFTIIVTAAVYVLFVRILGIMLPTGKLF